MSTDVVTIGPDAALPFAVKLLVEYGIGCLPVVAGDVVVGIITNTDLHVVLEGLLDARLPEPVELPF
jgi:CBS domain-containing protein